MKSIEQSLAGRVAILNLIALSAQELARAGKLPKTVNSFIYAGGYPRVYDKEIDPADYYPSYIQTYLERDVRSTGEVTKLAEFERMLGLCAARNAGMLNMEALSRDYGVALNTVKGWLSILEASFLIHRLRPYYKNLGKRIVKTPKLYVRGTGLTCSLLGIESPSDIDLTSQKGSLFEAAMLEEISKSYLARGRKPKLYYWRDSSQREIDILIEQGTTLTWTIEVKNSATY